MRRGLMPFLVISLLTLGGLALGACAIQLPDGTQTEGWLKDRNKYQ